MELHASDLPLVNHLDATTPRLRRELVFRPGRFGGKTCYVVEDPVHSRFFRIGVAEYTFISLLDGRVTIGEAWQATRQARPDCDLHPADAAAICQWVFRMGLAQDEATTAADVSAVQHHAVPARRLGGRVTPLTVQLPLFHPDRFFERLSPYTSWCFSLPAAVGWMLVIGWAIRDLLAQGDQLSRASTEILVSGNWIWLGLTWLLLKTIHECGHAAACKRLGGEVREAGVIFILFAPLAYVDVTSSWRLSSKWDRIQVAAAGMYVELLLAALATLVWSRTQPGPLNQICFNVMVSASVMTVLFNANPLMRFDGYYVLSDLLELPNLYPLGQQSVSRAARKLCFGVDGPWLADKTARGLLTLVYGIAALVWRNLVLVGLVVSAATLLQGAGIVLSSLAIVAWTGALIRRSVRFIRDNTLCGLQWLRCAVIGGGGAAALAAILAWAPWPGAVAAWAIVQYAPETVVRTESDGLVASVHVRGGQYVEQGELLAVMVNRDLEAELATLNSQLESSRLTARMHRRQGELARAQAEDERRRNLESQYADKRREAERLVIRAPSAGQVVGRHLERLPGTYLTKGSELLSLGDEARKEIRLAIRQADRDAFQDRLGNTVRAYVPGADVLRGTLTKLEPRASSVPVDPSLGAPYGGPLAVRRADRSPDSSTPGDWELIFPCFAGTVALDAWDGARVFAGQRARVAVRPNHTVGAHLYHLLADWFDTKLGRAAPLLAPH